LEPKSPTKPELKKMTKDPDYNRLREISWRPKLTPAEAAELRAWLGAHPGQRRDFEAETALNDALESLPQAVVASNFTKRVLESVAREAAASTRAGATERLWWPPRVRWLARAALAALVLGSGLFFYQRHHAASQREAYVQSVIAVSEIPSLANPQVLEDFDAIRALNPTSPDTDLLALLE